MSQRFIFEVQNFLDKRVIPNIAEYWSSEVSVSIESTIQCVDLEQFDVIIETPRRNLKKFSVKQLSFVREALLFDEGRNDIFKSIIFNIDKEIEFRMKGQIELYIREQLSHTELYLLVLEKYRTRKRSFFGKLHGKEILRDKKLYSFAEIIQLLCPKCIKIPKNRPKKTQRIRGYRDHGTLGSDTPDKGINDTLAMKTVLENEAKAKDLVDFIRGLIV